MYSARVVLAAIALLAGLPAVAAPEYGHVEFANSGAPAARPTSSRVWLYCMILSTSPPQPPFAEPNRRIRISRWRTGVRR